MKGVFNYAFAVLFSNFLFYIVGTHLNCLEFIKKWIKAHGPHFLMV